ncbi:MAG: hypothetical protein LBR73_01615 [Oscillospiraceae bacterium]|jgi:formate C-acetyltransferase|nr:hypothetical protein [Oscillospiraceae bacterium]
MPTITKKDKNGVKIPYNLSPRIQWLRDYYFRGTERPWNNAFMPFTTGAEWDELYEEQTFYNAPETYCFYSVMNKTFRQSAYEVLLPKMNPVTGERSDFFSWSLPERKAWFTKEVMVHYLPQEILPGDLIAGGRFNLMASRCWNRKEAKRHDELLHGKDGKSGLHRDAIAFEECGFGNCGATSGHLISNYPKALRIGWKGIKAEIREKYDSLTAAQRKGSKGNQLRAMLTACDMPIELAARYAVLCRKLAVEETNAARKAELEQMAANLDIVPAEAPQNFWQAIQSLWLTHMLIMSDENYPGPGVSFGRLDQYMYPFWQKSIEEGMDREFGKEILKCFWMHCNTAYDAMINSGNQGITAGYGQLFNISGRDAAGNDQTNDFTWVLLETLDEMAPILEPKPNVRLHKNTPDDLLDKVVDMIADSQGAPFLLNFDERSMAGMLREARMAGVEDKIHPENVHEYASVGCLENTMCGNDRSATVDCNLNLYKALELALGGGGELVTYVDGLWNKPYPPEKNAPRTGDPCQFTDFEQLWDAFAVQMKYIVKKMVDLYNRSCACRAAFGPTPYLSCLVEGCADKGLDVTQGGAELSFVTIEGVTFATTVDSLLAVKYLVFDKKLCTMEELIQALKANWLGFEKLQAIAKNKAPKYGRDDDEADALARRVMDLWSEETWRYTTPTGARYRPGMLSWNYWIGQGFILPASPDGRCRGQFLSNAICPVNGADINGPTSNANSVGIALGGFAEDGEGDFEGYLNALPNGASHTMTLSPALLRDDEHREKLKSFLRGYIANGGTALQINVLDADMLRDAQAHPENYKNLLVRVTGYNAYFTSVGKELQDEIIARESHNNY